MWVTKLLISPVKKGFFAPKRPNLAPNWNFCPLLAHLVPCWWVRWWLWCGLYLARHLFTLLYIYYVYKGIARKGRGDVKACQDGLGHFFPTLPAGVRACQDGLGGWMVWEADKDDLSACLCQRCKPLR